MIIQLFIFALFFIVFGIISILRKKKFLGFFFILLGLLTFAIGAVVVSLYPNTLPF
jgi:uncharacterized membrane protein HdeD (DUF308 family)